MRWVTFIAPSLADISGLMMLAAIHRTPLFPGAASCGSQAWVSGSRKTLFQNRFVENPYHVVSYSGRHSMPTAVDAAARENRRML